MKLTRVIGFGVMLLAAQLPALCAEVAVLRNGFSIRFERKEQIGETIRLYIRGGYIDVSSREIASFDPDDGSDTEAPSAHAPIVTSQNLSTQPVVSIASFDPDDGSGTEGPSAPAPIVTSQNLSTQPVVSAVPAQVTPVAAAVAPRVDLDNVVRDASNRHRLDPDFVNSVIKAESNFKSRAVSPKGAQGLMQLMPDTASKLGVKDPFDPTANVEGGTAYLSQLLDRYKDDPIKALAAYNAGAHRVEQYHGVPPYRETREYVARIVRDFNAKKRAQMKAAAPATKTVKKKASTPASQQEAAVTKPNKPT
jgi:soluble lytic murein transglycosylase-like protein